MFLKSVIDFHRKFGIDGGSNESNVCRLLPEDIAEFRIKFLEEELNEIKEGFKNEDVYEIIDGLMDLIYVAIGTLDLMELHEDQIRDHWNEIQRANMSKERAESEFDSRSKRNHSLDIVKPEGWVGPNHEKIMTKYVNEYFRRKELKDE